MSLSPAVAAAVVEVAGRSAGNTSAFALLAVRVAWLHALSKSLTASALTTEAKGSRRGPAPAVTSGVGWSICNWSLSALVGTESAAASDI